MQKTGKSQLSVGNWDFSSVYTGLLRNIKNLLQYKRETRTFAHISSYLCNFAFGNSELPSTTKNQEQLMIKTE